MRVHALVRNSFFSRAERENLFSVYSTSRSGVDLLKIGEIILLPTDLLYSDPEYCSGSELVSV